MSKRRVYSWVRVAEIVFPLILLAFCLTLFFMGFKYRPRTRQLPQVTAVLTSALILVHLYSTRKVVRETEPMPKASRRSLLVLLGIIPLFMVALVTLGFAPSSILLIFTLMWTLGMRSVTTLAAVPVGTTLFLYYVFGKLLGVPLPAGVILPRVLG
ncbi:MAG: tripartite tricarboxylate transporter TctB family protein [Firmicutes bacterium]|jgi:putative tricarboxylic transport membrane protein|nr:tripartite tricarboxylate transporter TctB family protein [Bacillota bacterium]